MVFAGVFWILRHLFQWRARHAKSRIATAILRECAWVSGNLAAGFSIFLVVVLLVALYASDAGLQRSTLIEIEAFFLRTSDV